MPEPDGFELVDALGVEHPEIALHVTPRIVCLVPSITELLFDLGLGQYMVGRTGFCIHPKPLVQAVSKVGGTKDVNIEKIRKLAPTHLIVNIDENEKPTVDLLAQFIPHVIVTHPNHPRDNLNLFRLLGGVFRRQEQASELCEKLQCGLRAFETEQRQKTLRVMYCIWKDPWMTVSADTYIAQMLGLRGWHQWTCETKPQRYPSFEWAQVDLNTVDAILLSTEPYSFTENHAKNLREQLGKPVTLVDGEMLSWYGSRVIQGLDYLRNLSVL